MKRHLLMGVTCYGQYHVDLFHKYCLPSLMAKGNLPALMKEYNVGIVLHTDEASAKLFKKGLPAPILDVTHENKYTQLGKHQNKDLRIAKDLGADYHCLMPDYVYSEDYFIGVLNAVERGHKAIVRLVMSSIEEDMTPELDRPRSAIDLSTLALKHIHPGIRNWCITPKGYPRTHVIAYVGKDTIRMQSPHCSPVYIANEVMNPIDSEFPLDSILDEIIIGDIYCPKPEDGIVMIELSARNSRVPQYACVEMEEFLRIFKWDTRDSLRQKYIFEQETVDAIHTQTNCWEDKEIDEMKKTVYDALYA